MNWIMWLILVVIIVTFMFFGIYPSSSTGRFAAKVDDEVISYDEWNRAYQNIAETYRQILKDQYNDNFAKTVKNQALQELIQNRVLDREADRMGIKVSDDEVRQSILGIPAFSPSGKFDNRTYQMYLDRINITPAVFEASQRGYLRRQRLISVIEDSVAVTDAEVDAAVKTAAKGPADAAREREAKRQQLLTKKRQDALDIYVAGLKLKAKIKIGDAVGL
jgi:peptidyl-prolyl cis-trans isomerase D